MSLIQPMNFKKMETVFHKMATKLESHFKMGIIITGFTVVHEQSHVYQSISFQRFNITISLLVCNVHLEILLTLAVQK